MFRRRICERLSDIEGKKKNVFRAFGANQQKNQIF
jgi:hypothetical protein